MTQGGQMSRVLVMTQADADDDTPGRRFGNLIREGRRRKGWTQEEVEEHSGVSRQTVIGWESGRAVNPKPTQVRAVCLALEIDPREAPVALGFFSREELGLPARHAVSDKTISEIVEQLDAPDLGDDEREELLDYIRWYRQRRARHHTAS